MPALVIIRAAVSPLSSMKPWRPITSVPSQVSIEESDPEALPEPHLAHENGLKAAEHPRPTFLAGHFTRPLRKKRSIRPRSASIR